MAEPITFVIAVSDQKVYENNFLSSPLLKMPGNYQLIKQENYPSAAKAYNDALDRATTDLIVFVHQDIYFPESWLSDLEKALHYLEGNDPNWGVLGCGGITENGQIWTHVYSSGLGILGNVFDHPMTVQTLDEIVLIVKKSSGLRFDEGLPHFHLYGTDICLSAQKRGLKCYALSAFCIHNTEQILILPEQFYECYGYIKRVWRDSLPIQTCCIRLTRFDVPMRIRKLKEMRLRTFGLSALPVHRAKSALEIVEELKRKGQLQPAVPLE